MERPEFTTALSALQPGDTLVFRKSDRWGRSAAHVLTTIGELRDRAVTVKSLTENFDLDTKEGRYMSPSWPPPPNTNSNCAPNARPKASPPPAARRRLLADGASVTQAARTLKISRSTAYSALATTR